MAGSLLTTAAVRTPNTGGQHAKDNLVPGSEWILSGSMVQLANILWKSGIISKQTL